MAHRSIMPGSQPNTADRRQEDPDRPTNSYYNMPGGRLPLVMAVAVRPPPVAAVEAKPFKAVTLTFTGAQLLLLDWSLWEYREKVISRKRRVLSRLRAADESPEIDDREALQNSFLRHTDKEKSLLYLHVSIAYVVPRTILFDVAKKMPACFHGPLAIRALEECGRPPNQRHPSPFDNPSLEDLRPELLNALADLMKDWQKFSFVLCDNSQDEQKYTITIGQLDVAPPSEDSAAAAKTEEE